MTEQNIETLLEERRTFPPPEEFARQANVNDPSVYERAEEDFEGFWADFARELHWFKEWDQVLKWERPYAEWFVGGKLNVSYNCLDYQIEQGRGDKRAIIWEGDEPGDSREITYSQLKADEALEDAPSIEGVVVVQRTGEEVNMTEGRDLWYHDLMAEAAEECPAEEMDSEDILYILYSSGSTGKPKGIVHTTGGYLTGVYATTKWVFDIKEDDVYWCQADIGWVTGHSYLVYGPLSNGATTVQFEGTPSYPGPDRHWDLIERHGVTIYYSAPTVIRAFMKQGTEPIEKHDLSSLRLLGTVGEPINPRAWEWYH